ncbi:30S ribosomal protein S4 [bacterium DOLZORAL124_38_8]|nr:MAG: 30S ribosomal protein S4 [bacterium DOLZORAL124_38_8]
MRYTGPKARLCRREGVNLFGSPKYQKVMARRASVPGAQSGKRMSKISEFGKQLREKQKAKRIFCLSEKQFKKYFEKASRKPGVAGDNLLFALEHRFDNVLYRSGFAMTRMQARQFASHGLFLLNGRRVDVPSIEVKVGDVIEARPKTKKSPILKSIFDELENHNAPKWLKVDRTKMTIEVIGKPELAETEVVVNAQLIVEFYSR